MTNTEILENLCIREIPLVNTYIAHTSDYPMRNKGRYHCGLLYTITGTEIYTFDDKTLHACPGSVLIIPKNEAYQIDLNDEESVVCAVDFELADTPSFRPFLIKPKENSGIKAVFNEMLKVRQNKTTRHAPALKALFYRIISLLILEESVYANSENYSKIAMSVEYLHNHYLDTDFRLKDASDASGISKRYFEKLFFAEYKMTPRDYIIMQKTELAKELLQSEKNSVTNVALALGYSDIYQFSKMFKLKTGFSPSEYRHKKLP